MTNELAEQAVPVELPVLRIAPPRGWLDIDFKELWEARELIYFFVWRDIKVRYSHPGVLKERQRRPSSRGRSAWPSTSVMRARAGQVRLMWRSRCSPCLGGADAVPDAGQPHPDARSLASRSGDRRRGALDLIGARRLIFGGWDGSRAGLSLFSEKRSGFCLDLD